jgi:hypothetical protein
MKNNVIKWRNNLVASITSSLLPVFAIYDYTFAVEGDGQAGLIFLFIPFYAAILGSISYLITHVIQKIKSLNIKLGEIPRSVFMITPSLLIVCFLVNSMISINREVYMSIAASSMTPISDLRFLYRKAQENNDYGIFHFLAQNEKLPSDILEGMSDLPFSSVRVFIAGHPNTPTPIVERMTKDKVEYIRKNAFKELNRRSKIRNSKSVQPSAGE